MESQSQQVILSLIKEYLSRTQYADIGEKITLSSTNRPFSPQTTQILEDIWKTIDAGHFQTLLKHLLPKLQLGEAVNWFVEFEVYSHLFLQDLELGFVDSNATKSALNTLRQQLRPLSKKLDLISFHPKTIIFENDESNRKKKLQRDTFTTKTQFLSS